MSDAANAQPDPTPPTQPAQTPPRQNYAWVGYFAFLIVASVGVAVFMIWFNLRIQLKPDELETNHKLWTEKGPKDYNLAYTQNVNGVTTNFLVKVRAGKVVEAMMNGKPLEPDKDTPEHDPRLYHSMDRIYAYMERFMDLDQKKDAPKVYVVATFDPETGAVLKYIRNVMTDKTERVELNLKLERVEKRTDANEK